MDQYLLSAGAHAFGDGAHETTRSTLAAIETIDPSLFTPRHALDVGAGSGITSFAVLHRFGCSVLATDVSASAVETLSSNISTNGLAAQIQALRADGFDHPAIASAAPYDLIVMNILAEPLMRLAADAYAHLADGGVLILGGILTWQDAAMTEAYHTLGLELTARLALGDWVAQIWQKP
jgi:ribosomal protein L11 methyltransferase